MKDHFLFFLLSNLSIFSKFDYDISCIGPFECTLLGIEPSWMFIFRSFIKFGKLSEIYFNILYTLFSCPETPTVLVSVHLVVFHSPSCSVHFEHG